MSRRDQRAGALPGPATGYAEQVALLLQVAEQALVLQPDADAEIRACGAPETVPDQVAVRLGEVLRGYSRLHHQVDDLDADPDLAQVRRDLLGQLSYHLHMLRDAGDLVFSGRQVAVNERFRRELAGGLGPHAEGLARLRDALAARAAAGSGR
jgi:hypothetical protein